ncbi:MAG: hypothetical protein OSJ72_11425 [Lachnospiraceae bacterium]|nr:hypothetical protein [Lachnospiraceae bacterium]
MTKIRMDFIPCLLIGGLLLGGTIFAGQKYVEMADNRYETQELPQGEVGGVPTDDTPLVESIAEMKQHDTFYVVTDDENYEMYHLFYDDKEWNPLKLPSGEVVCVRNNSKASETVDGFKKQTPVGKIVPFEIPETLITQLEEERSGFVFADTTFYVDMFGEALSSANEDDIKFKFDIAAVILFWVGTFGSHMIGAKIGILPPVFPKRKKEQA